MAMGCVTAIPILLGLLLALPLSPQIWQRRTVFADRSSPDQCGLQSSSTATTASPPPSIGGDGNACCFRFPSSQGMRLERCLKVYKMGIVNYMDGLKLQERLVSARKMRRIPDSLLSLQHPPTYTLGKRRTHHNLLVPEAELPTIGAELHYTERGGDITFHGPRQAILYPIISLRDIGLGVRKYVENLEHTMIELASLYGVQATAGKPGQTGVWVGEKKIGAIGVQISSGITSHGLAFNIDPDLDYFKHIVPCGIADKGVTSLRRESRLVLPVDEVIHEQLVCCFAKFFGFSDVSWEESLWDLLENEKIDEV